MNGLHGGMTKDDLRAAMRRMKAAMTAGELAAMSVDIIRRLTAMDTVRKASAVVMYHPLPDEVDTRKAIDMLAAQGKTVMLPCVTGDGEMELRIYDGPDSLACGAFGIMEPRLSAHSTTKHLPTSQSTVIIVPGMAFDREGNRLGRGKGYYDRMLRKMRGIQTVGLCFPFQLVDSVPHTPDDVPVDVVVC